MLVDEPQRPEEEADGEAVLPAVEGLPPGPRWPKAAQSAASWFVRPRFGRWCRKRYGDAYTIHAEPGGRLVVLADPDDIRTVFTGSPRVFHAGEGNGLLEPVLGSRSLLLLDEDEHLTERRVMLPAFHGDHVAGYVTQMRAAAAEEVARWPVGRAFALHPRMQALTLDVILRVVLGVDDAARARELGPALRRMVELRGWHLPLWVYPRLARVEPWRGVRRRVEAADAMLRAEVARRRADPALAQRDDVLSMLLRARRQDGSALDDREVRDELVTLLLAGHETTATGLAWAFERLLRHPAALARVRAGLDDDRDPYRDAVVKETLRVRPVIWNVARALTEPAVVAGHRLPAGTLVMPSIGLVQADDAHFADAAAFRPERWLEGPPPPYTWIPFGGGTRRCLGATFASVEMAEVLRTVLSRAELRPDRPQAERVRQNNITMVPGRGARVVRVA